MTESQRWKQSKDDADKGVGGESFAMSEIGDLFTGRNGKALLFIVTVFGAWNLVAGTYGFFYSYILSTLGVAGRGASYGLQALWFISAMVGVVLVFMRYGDHANRLGLYIVSGAMQVVAFLLFLVFPISQTWVAVANVVLFGFGHEMAA